MVPPMVLGEASIWCWVTAYHDEGQAPQATGLCPVYTVCWHLHWLVTVFVLFWGQNGWWETVQHMSLPFALICSQCACPRAIS